MSTQFLLRSAGTFRAAVAVVVTLGLAVGLGAGLARPQRAGALDGLEELVGAIDPAVRAQLPADPRLYASYSLRATPNSCRNGSPTCVDSTIADMTRRFNGLAPRCDHDAVFSLLYLRVTERYRQLAAIPGQFVSVRTVNWEDRVFYDLYAGSFADWHASRPASVPPIWRLAYAGADAKQLTGSGDVILAMAAHILRDLPFALWRVSMGARSDHLQINAMLRSVYRSVVAELARRFDPTITLADVVPGSNVLVVDAIAQWRDKAWRDGQALLAAPTDAARTEVAYRIEREAWATGLTIYLGLRYPVQQATATRDTYCAANWNS
jgi:hypothetical protein